jgi:ribonuclease G
LTELWIDDAPGERRAALVENGNMVEVHIQRDLHLALGGQNSGRIDRKTPSGAYVVSDDDDEVLVRRSSPKPEGARVGFEITRESICEPGRVKPPEATLLDDVSTACSDQRQLWETRLKRFGDLPRRNADISAAFDAALAGVSQMGDATISFQRTKAGLVFDVDGVGDPMAANLMAAREIARLLRLYQVGGVAMIDFIAVESKDHRQAIAAAFDEASEADSRSFERSAINGFGLMQVVRARPRPSILDQLFGTRIAALSDETQALWLLREAGRSSGFGQRTITARNAVANLLASQDWVSFRIECERQTGAPLVIVVDEQITGYGHVHVAQS